MKKETRSYRTKRGGERSRGREGSRRESEKRPKTQNEGRGTLLRAVPTATTDLWHSRSLFHGFAEERRPVCPWHERKVNLIAPRKRSGDLTDRQWTRARFAAVSQLRVEFFHSRKKSGCLGNLERETFRSRAKRREDHVGLRFLARIRAMNDFATYFVRKVVFSLLVPLQRAPHIVEVSRCSESSTIIVAEHLGRWLVIPVPSRRGCVVEGTFARRGRRKASSGKDIRGGGGTIVVHLEHVVAHTVLGCHNLRITAGANRSFRERIIAESSRKKIKHCSKLLEVTFHTENIILEETRRRISLHFFF